MKQKIVTIFGGTGFLGRQIVRELAKIGYGVKVATRVPEHAYFLKPCGTPGQIVPVAVDYKDSKTISEALKGSDFVVNCIGILFEKKKGGFDAVHHVLAETIAKAAKKEGVKRLVHISALGVDKANSKYAKSKLAGEKAVLKNFKAATILRPSVIFGKDDDFFNRFAEMSRYVPVLPLIGGGQTKFQPVFVGDVADAAVQALTCTKTGEDSPEGQIYELGGPDILTFREIYERIFAYTGRRRCLISMPWTVAKIQGCIFSILPTPPLTSDQVEGLKTDNIVSGQLRGLKELGIKPVAIESIVPSYLETYRAGGRFA